MGINTDETKLGTWTTNMIMPGGAKYLGKLTVTDRNVYFEAKFDSSISGLVSSALLEVKDADGILTIPRDSIEKIEPKTSFFKKKINIKVKEHGDFVVDYGMLSISSMLKALGA